MTLYLDVHTVPGARIEDVVEARLADLRTQGAYGVRFLRYWFSADAGKVFCLVDAPSAIAASQVHLEAHGGTASEIFAVREGS